MDFWKLLLASPIGGQEVVLLRAPGYGGDVTRGTLAIGIGIACFTQ